MSAAAAWLDYFDEKFKIKKLCDECPNIKSLCEKYPVIELKYIFAIDHGQDTLDNAMLGSGEHILHIPYMLNRCKNDLNTLKIDRARNYYDEYNNSPVLDIIEEKLETVTENLEKQSQLHQDYTVEKILQKATLRYMQLQAQAMGKNHPNLKNYMDK